MTAILFLDVETMGLDPRAPIWELAVIRVVDDAVTSTVEMLIDHDPGNWLDDPEWPAEFKADYQARYVAANVMPRTNIVSAESAISYLQALCADRPKVAGSNPAFDMVRLERLAEQEGLQLPGWHYHPIDIPSEVHGYLNGLGVRPAQPWRSEFLSQAIGVPPNRFARHTARGDSEWCLAQWRVITGQVSS